MRTVTLEEGLIRCERLRIYILTQALLMPCLLLAAKYKHADLTFVLALAVSLVLGVSLAQYLFLLFFRTDALQYFRLFKPVYK